MTNSLLSVRNKHDSKKNSVKVLFILEPVIFRDSAKFLTAHFIFVEYFYSVFKNLGYDFALSANLEVCIEWKNNHEDTIIFPLNPFNPLIPFNMSKHDYSQYLYEEIVMVQDGNEILHIKQNYVPDIVITTSQSSIVKTVFSDAIFLHIEQAPLPRLGQPLRFKIDPMGGEVNSMIELEQTRIKNCLDNPDTIDEMLRLLDEIKHYQSINFDPQEKIKNYLILLRQSTKIALFVLQPNDWITYEGAYDAISPENTLYKWASSLPDGWVGIPVYHIDPRSSLSQEQETTLAAHTHNLHFLPKEYSQGIAEALLPYVDGVVTITSTTAFSALLYGKKVIVTGKSPLSSWVSNLVECIEEGEVLSKREIASTLAFLTNNYSYLLNSNYERIQVEKLISNLLDKNPVDIYFDFSDWSVQHAYSLFNVKL